MIAFELYLNGKKLCTAGVGNDGVLSAHVTWVRRTGERTRSRKPNSAEEQLTMDVGGLVCPADEHVRWHEDQAVQVGDEVRIKIVETNRVDRPSARKRRNVSEDLRRQKRYVREMAKRFGWKISPLR
jgi:D-lyxose ketol-isomerase